MASKNKQKYPQRSIVQNDKGKQMGFIYRSGEASSPAWTFLVFNDKGKEVYRGDKSTYEEAKHAIDNHHQPQKGESK